MEKIKSKNKVYNNTFEIAIRVLVILANLPLKRSSIYKLMVLDHISLNTYDVGGPASLHAPIPNRGVQIYSRKEILNESIKLLISKDLISLVPSINGLLYEIANNGINYLSYFESKYFNQLKDKVEWTTKKFGNFTDEDLKTYVNQNLSKWGEEFMTDGNQANQV
ncbi:ABC-three component system middle component 2 [Tenacibaculum sp. 190524A02b]|uniref:ABC-three component system middle component 2 n=1 Tax=Tenacibaculum vairaonense TaxID=3137860 RepID=UPI0031FA7494